MPSTSRCRTSAPNRFNSAIESKIKSALYVMENRARFRKRWLEGEDISLRIMKHILKAILDISPSNLVICL